MKFKTLVLLSSLGLLTSIAMPQAEPVLRVATGDYAPFTDSEAADGGLANKVVAELAAESGLEVSFDYLPWMRSLELTRAGRYEATSYWLYSEERAEDFIHVGPILQDRLVFFRLADTQEPRWTSTEELSEFTIGAVPSYTYGDDFWRLAEDGAITVETAPTDEANMRKLVAGRIDLFPMSEAAGWKLIESIFSEQQRASLVASQQPLLVTDGYLLVSRAVENAELIANMLQTALDKVETASR